MAIPQIQHAATVQCCEHCQSGMVWDSKWSKHVPADEWAYEHWQGPSLGLLNLFQENAEVKWELVTCRGNLYRLASMATREVVCLRMFLKDLQEATTKQNGHVYKDDVRETEVMLKEWARLFKLAAKVAGDIPEVKALETI